MPGYCVPGGGCGRSLPLPREPAPTAFLGVDTINTHSRKLLRLPPILLPHQPRVLGVLFPPAADCPTPGLAAA